MARKHFWSCNSHTISFLLFSPHTQLIHWQCCHSYTHNNINTPFFLKNCLESCFMVIFKSLTECFKNSRQHPVSFDRLGFEERITELFCCFTIKRWKNTPYIQHDHCFFVPFLSSRGLQSSEMLLPKQHDPWKRNIAEWNERHVFWGKPSK